MLMRALEALLTFVGGLVFGWLFRKSREQVAPPLAPISQAIDEHTQRRKQSIVTDYVHRKGRPPTEAEIEAAFKEAGLK